MVVAFIGGLGAVGTLHGSEGMFGYLVPAESLTVVRVAR